MFRALKIVQGRAYIKEVKLLFTIKKCCKLSAEAGTGLHHIRPVVERKIDK
jgi:hypothetical protein